jgi:molybdopterin converting factor small subunit
MRVDVRLFAGLRSPVEDASPGISFGVDLGIGATLSDLVGYLRLPAEQVRMTFVNGRSRPLDWALQPQDQVGIFPPIGGG